MQPCSASAPALASPAHTQPRLVAPTPDYINYTAHLLLASSTLLAQVGTCAGMDQSRPSQSHENTDWHRSLENPPTSRWANVRVTDWQRVRRPSSAPSSVPESDDERGPRKLSRLEALLIRRRPEESSGVPPRSLSPFSYQSTQEYTSNPESISGPSTMPPASHYQEPRHPEPLRVPARSSGRNYTTQTPLRTVSSDYPTSPEYFYPISPLDRPRSSSHNGDHLRSPLRAARTYSGAPWDSSPNRVGQEQRRPSTAFESDAELHRFAEATSGFDPFSPVRQRPLSQALYREYYAPPEQAPQQAISYTRPLPQYPFREPSYSIDQNLAGTRSPSELAAALRAMEEAENDYGMPPEDEELPDYAQSQWEAQSHQRRAAARRAAELERQWIEARQRSGSR
ncbi:histone-lysine n-methyltransferase 2d isoform x1 [Diplodia corticola]|uniref:Histone-lysine n-methyltransferase 2d isoform x1 n=1 Tax=Diplodia corticola TaxID=236234 RepID=A0A1J9S9U0_9PEZI|nr:histone-lysine n-methyltransferase 2d isoform x1 [Diplodia corticola]OJD36349.1 histone-lysine n-methyltransferase 2d isoform x1 [Diplodia corticola]